MKFEFGDEVKDIVTGLTGIVTGFTSYITGCEQYLVQPQSNDKTKKPDASWIDEDRLEVIFKGAIRLKTSKDGADQPAPIR